MLQHQNITASQMCCCTLKMLWHMQCCSMLCNAVAPLHHAAAYCTMPWHIAQCHGTKNSTTAQSKMLWHKKQHSWYIANAVARKKHHSTKHNTMAQKHGKMPQHIMEGHGTKHNATALITLPQNKAQCCSKKLRCSTKTALQHKNSNVAQKTAQQHKVQCCST